MVVKKIIQNCKNTKCIALCEDRENDIQWIGDGFSLYPLYCMPKFDTETICRAYDISEKQKEKIHFVHDDLPKVSCYEDIDDGEHICDPMEMTLIYEGAQVQPYMTSQGIKFLNQTYIAPVGDEGNLYMEVYERFTPSGHMCFAVKTGMQLLAIVAPTKVVSQSFVETLRELYTRSKIVLESEENPNA